MNEQSIQTYLEEGYDDFEILTVRVPRRTKERFLALTETFPGTRYFAMEVALALLDEDSTEAQGLYEMIREQHQAMRKNSEKVRQQRIARTHYKKSRLAKLTPEEIDQLMQNDANKQS